MKMRMLVSPPSMTTCSAMDETYPPAPGPAHIAETRAGHEFWINDAAELLLAVAAALKASPSDSPCNDEPYALVADGYRYWRLRHAYEVICGPLDFDGYEDEPLGLTYEEERARQAGYEPPAIDGGQADG